MTPKQVIETDEKAGLEATGEPLASNGGALNVLLPSETDILSPAIPTAGQFSPPEERSRDDIALDVVIDALPNVFIDMVTCLEEDRKMAKRMHDHYADLATNNQSVDMATTADQMAKDYLAEMIRVDQEKVNLVKAVSSIATKRKPSGSTVKKNRVENMVVATPGSQINLFNGKSRREILQDIKQKRMEDKP